MTKAEYFTNKYHCHISCDTEIDKCKNFPILRVLKEIYGDEEI